MPESILRLLHSACEPLTARERRVRSSSPDTGVMVGDGTDRVARLTLLPDTQRHCYLCTLIRKDYGVI